MKNVVSWDMDIRFLSSLVAVAETGSFARAARQQNLTSATVAQRIRALEMTLNLSLVTRVGQTVLPTDQCKALLPRIKHILREAGHLRGDADANGRSGLFRLGAISTALGDTVPAIVQRFAALAPDAALKIQPGTSAALYNAVCAGDLDLALIVAPPFALSKGLTAHGVTDQPMVLVVPEAEVETDAAAICARNPILVYDRTSWGGQIAWAVLTRLCDPLDIRCELDALETIATLVARGLGVSVLPRWGGLQDTVGIRTIPLNGPVRRIIAVASVAPVRPALVALCMGEQ
jgi:DNA-binding transcriptional LysR family regulator